MVLCSRCLDGILHLLHGCFALDCAKLEDFSMVLFERFVSEMSM